LKVIIMKSNYQSRSHKRSWLWSPAGLTLLVFLGIGTFYLLAEHTAHTFGALPYLLFLAFPLMHIFMHGGHGSQSQHGGHAITQNTSVQHNGHSAQNGQAAQDGYDSLEGEFYTSQNPSVGRPYPQITPPHSPVSTGQTSPQKASSQVQQASQNRQGHCH